MKLHVGAWVCAATLSILAGCGSDEGLRQRFVAERARYWAEREDIRFALESNPDVRARYAASALAHERVAELASPPESTAGAVLEDLLRLRGEALLRAGEARLNAGDWADAERRLQEAIVEAPAAASVEAAWLLGDAYLAREQYGDATIAFATILDHLGDPAFDRPPPERFIGLPVRVAQILQENDERDLLASWVPRARDAHSRVALRWEGTWTERRVRFLNHRLSLAEENVVRAIEELEGFEAWCSEPADRLRAKLVRAELLAARLGKLVVARRLQSEIVQQTTDPELRSLARLRLADLELLQGNAKAAADSFRALTKDREVTSVVVSAAESRLARIQRESGDIVGAVQSYRRLVLRFGDTPAGLRAPMEIIALAEEAADGRTGGRTTGLDPDRARHQAVEQYRRVLDLHPGDSPVGLLARERLVVCLVGLGRAEEALLESEQLYHVVGPTPRGLAALNRSGTIALEGLQRADLARRYWERVLSEAPASKQALEAKRLLDSLHAQ